jgi:hypothetical protein
MHPHKITGYYPLLIVLLCLSATFIFRDFDPLCMRIYGPGFYHPVAGVTPKLNFIVNKSWRFLLNAGAGIYLISWLFGNRPLTLMVLYIQLFILIVFMPLYFYFAFSTSPLLYALYEKLNALLINPVIPLLVIIITCFNRKKY